MPKNVNDLRDKLFSVIDGLTEGKITVDVAAQICDVANTIMQTAVTEASVTNNSEVIFLSNSNKVELFDVDKEKNWLSDEGEPISSNSNSSTNQLPVGKDYSSMGIK